MDKKDSLDSKERIEEVLIQKKISKNTIENKYDLDLVEGTEAVYSERYGWTLRKVNN